MRVRLRQAVAAGSRTGGLFRHKVFLLLLCCTFLLLIYTIHRKRHHSHKDPFPVGHFVRSSPPHEGVRGTTNTGGEGGEDPRVTCMVVTSPVHHQDRAIHAGATWGRLSPPHRVVFLTSGPHDPRLSSVILSNYSSYQELWGKVVEGLRALDAAASDWFMKVDDDSFVVFPNLLQLLAQYDPAQPLLLGFPLTYTHQNGQQVDYMSGGSGYVLSRAALLKFQESPHYLCRVPGVTSYEDVNMGACMTALGVEYGDTRDSQGRPRFLPYAPWVILNSRNQHHPRYHWLHTMSKHPFMFGATELSEYVVSFHEIRDPNHFYVLHYLSQVVQVEPPRDLASTLHTSKSSMPQH